MSAIIDIGPLLPVTPANPATTSTPRSTSRIGDERDVVEFSAQGRALARAVRESSLRIAKTRAIRAEIEAGTYETPERIQGTVQRLLDVLA